MAEYIEREALLGNNGIFAKRGCTGNCGNCPLWSEKGCRVILEAPAADVAPVVQGRWKTDENRERTWCSVCDVNCGSNYDAAIEEMHFCPNCGAKMEG